MTAVNHVGMILDRVQAATGDAMYHEVPCGHLAMHPPSLACHMYGLTSSR